MSTMNKNSAEHTFSSDATTMSTETTTSIMSGSSENGIKRRIDDIKKSRNDKRVYRGLRLENDMKVLLISDPTTDKSAASLDVNIGYMSDPCDLPGLAHFCEHMLFLGTEKYPEKNNYNLFLSQHGGGSNAATHSDHTNYYFDITPDELEGALDRFSEFFLRPLFTESATELEVQAVHSEHIKNLANDVWRVDQLDKSSAIPDHPYAKFGTGNRETLDILPKQKGVNVRDELLKFHKEWYSANIMALSVLGKESLDDLQKMVVDKFAGVQNKCVTAPEWSIHPYNEEHFQQKWFIVPIKDVRSLKMTFPLPDMREHYRALPAHYLAHLLGHEGEGSVLSALKRAGWCNSLAAGERNAARGEINFFSVIVDLTEEGLEHVDDIVKIFFEYMNMLRTSGPLEWVFEETRQIAKMDFDFKEKSSPREYVNFTVRSLQKYPFGEVLCASCQPTEWRPDLIEEIMDWVTPEKIRIHILAKTFENIATESESWYGTCYKVEKIPKDTILSWQNAERNPLNGLNLPAMNEFVPMNFDIALSEDSKIEKYPVIIEDTPFMRVWFKQDDEFLLPKVNFTFDFSSPLAYMDPVSYNLTYMFVELFKDSLNEYAYNADLAGLAWEFNISKYGLTLSLGGYHDKHRVLLTKILDKMVDFTIDKQRFDSFKEYHIRTLKNFETEQPYQHAVYYLGVLLSEHVWTKNEVLAACEDITIERLEAFVPQLFSKIHIECLVHGNITEAEALRSVKLVESRLTKEKNRVIPLLPRQLMLHREISLDNGCHFLFEVENKLHKSSCTEIYYQSGTQSTESNMQLELLAQIISEPCFNTLRTKEQLGYIVFSGVRRTNGAQGLRIIVQSDRHPQFVEGRIESFIESMMERLVNMTDEEFGKHKASLKALRLEKPKMLNMLTAIFWSEISSQQYNFDRVNIEVAYLMTITKKQIIQFFKDTVHSQAPSRRKLAVHVVSMASGGAGLEAIEKPKEDDTCEEIKDTCDETPTVTKITDVMAFKSSQSLYPLMKPSNNIPRKGQRSKL